MRLFLSTLLTVVAVPALGCSAYLALLAVAARKLKGIPVNNSLRFAVVVPAHNEAAGIAATVKSLLAMQYPRELFRVIVVADNCDDLTSEHAHAAGAVVIERVSAEHRGKGFALAFAFDHILYEQWAGAVVVVDADTIVSPNMLSAFAGRLALGVECAQAEYGVRNSADSWRTRLMSFAFTLHHTLKSLGREQLGLSCGLRGNGMAFTTALLRRVPHRSTALAEDVEYGIQLGLAGVRVSYVPEATVLGEMPASEGASRSQRDRWERGRRHLRQQWTGPLLKAAVTGLGRVPLDLAADLLMPPLISVASMVAAGSIAAGVAFALGAVGALVPILWLVSLLLLLIFVGRGCALSPAGWPVLLDMIWVPSYAIWKLSQRFRATSGTGWVRTARSEAVVGERDTAEE